MAEKTDTLTTVGRDAKTGRFISVKKAERRKSTTTVEASKKQK